MSTDEIDRIEALERHVAELRSTIGTAPNLATGERGSGMARVLYELADRRETWRLAAGIVSAALTSATIAAIVSRLVGG